MLCFHAAQTGKHLLRTQNVSEQNQKHFLCPGHKICRQQMLCARTNGETFMSAAMCPRLPGPLSCPQNHKYGNFTLLFCRGRHGVVLKCVPHVQHAQHALKQNSVFIIQKHYSPRTEITNQVNLAIREQKALALCKSHYRLVYE